MIIDLNKIYSRDEFDLQFHRCCICQGQCQEYGGIQYRCYNCMVIIEYDQHQSKISNIWLGWDDELEQYKQPLWGFIPNNRIDGFSNAMHIRQGNNEIKSIPIGKSFDIKELYKTFEMCKLLI